MRRVVLAGLCVGGLGLGMACVGGTPQTPPVPAPEVTEPAEPDPDQDEEALRRAQAAVKTLKVTLKGRLVKAMGEGGPVAAASVCREEAQALTAKVGADTKVRVGRASLKTRRPENTGPDWVHDWLLAQQGRTAAEAEAITTVVDTPDGRVARVIEPLGIEAPCLACHGPEEGISDGVKAVLAEHYPQDQATGYAVGDLRGAVWAEAGVPQGPQQPDGPEI